MSKFIDGRSVPMSVGVFLAHDEYDFVQQPYTISVTALQKSVRQIILTDRLPPEARAESIYAQVKSRMGQALHTAIENCWKQNYRESLKALGYPERLINQFRINPETVEPGTIPVYLEQRRARKVGKWNVSGKFDVIVAGKLEDFKFTSTFVYSKQVKVEDYQDQMSAYRWLFQDIVQEDSAGINMVFWDWSAAKAKYSKDYPPLPVMQQTIPLLSVQEVETRIRAKLALLERYKDAPAEELPECTPKDLWIREGKYKYFKDPNKTSGRSTRTFDNQQDALTYQMSKGGVGVIQYEPAKAKACGYCKAAPICDQYKRLTEQGKI